MATDANTLLESAKCYDCYGSPGTWSLFELGLWKAYLLALDASADTSSTGLLESAKCYDCNGAAGEWTLFKLGLLKGILLAQTPGADTSTNALLEVAKCYNCYGSWPLLSLALIKQTVIAANASADTSSNALLESVKCYDCNGGPGTWQLYLLGILKKILINQNASADTSVTALFEAAKCYDCYGGGGIWNLISLGLLAQITGTPAPPVSTPWITAITPIATSNDFTGYVGGRILIGASDVTVTDLGKWGFAGDSHGHDVVIGDSNFTSILATASAISTTTIGGFNYKAITPIVLTAATNYTIMMSVVFGQDSFGNPLVPDSSTIVASNVVATFATSPGVGFGTSTPNALYGWVNFKYHL